MGTTTLLVALTVGIVGSSIPDKVVEKQNRTFQRFWGTDFDWKFDEQPTKGMVPKHRLPYSGYIYPDTAGGTMSVLRKYDYAFNRGRSSAASWEQWDTSSGAERPQRRGLFGWRRESGVPHWYGHCNGWTAATIRHAEPTKSVRYNGVTFSPAEIKGLLAEIYIYNESENLVGLNYSINAGAFHAILTNWLGRGSHPIGMEADPGEEKWNYPIYSYAYSSAKRPNRQVEVKINLAYAKDSNGEYNESPHIRRVKYFHYMLELNEEGEIVGGSFLYDSSRIDILWVPVRPRQGGHEGNKRGNPHVDVNKVLAIWRESVDEDIRKKWFNIDSPEEDRILDVSGVEGIVPLQGLAKAEPKPPAADAKDRKPDEADKEAVAARTEESEEGDAEASDTEPATADAESGDAEMTDAEPAADEAEDGDAETADAEPAATDEEDGDAETTDAEPAAADAENADAETTDAEPVADDGESGDSETTDAEPAADDGESGDSETADEDAPAVDASNE